MNDERDKLVDQIPEKTKTRAPGDMLGHNRVFIMEKPAGIESGFLALRTDSGGYRDYVEAIAKKLLDNPNDPSVPEKIREQFSVLNGSNRFESMDLRDIVDVLLNDSETEILRVKYSHEEKVALAEKGEFHKALVKKQAVNKGMGGLLLAEYQSEVLKIDKDTPWHKYPEKYMNNNNRVTMIKQDYITYPTGPTQERRAIIRTKKYKDFLRENPTKYKRAKYMAEAEKVVRTRNSTADEMNQAAITETISNKMMEARGIPSQTINLVRGTNKDGSTKLMMEVDWTLGMSDFTEKIDGGNTNTFREVVFDWDKDPDTGKVPTHPETGKKFSNPNFYNLGEMLILMIASGDRDGLGKEGNNKGYLRRSDGRYDFYGFDYGKAYEDENKRLDNLREDFTFEEPKSWKDKLPANMKIDTRMVNISMLADTSLVDKMKGVYLIAAMRQGATKTHLNTVADNYELRGDKEFADKLRIAINKPNTDIPFIDAQIETFQNDENLDPDDRARYIKRLKDMKRQVLAADNKVLAVFHSRLILVPDAIEAIDKLEKLTSMKVRTLSENGEVYLNHIQIPRDSRVAWKVTENKDGTYYIESKIPDGGKLDEAALRAVLNNLGLGHKIKKTPTKNFSLHSVTPEELLKIANVSELKIAQARGLRDTAGMERYDAVQARFVNPLPRPSHPAAPFSPLRSSRAVRTESPTEILEGENQDVKEVYGRIDSQKAQLDVEELKKDTQSDNFSFKLKYQAEQQDKSLQVNATASDGSVRYTARRKIARNDFQAVAVKMARIAVETCEPDTVFKPSMKLEAFQRDIMEQALSNAIDASPRFKDADVKPTVELSHAPVAKRM